MNESYDIEESILGCLLLSPELIKELVITDKCFLLPINRFAFNLLKKQYQDFGTINIVGLAENYKNIINKKFDIKSIISLLTSATNIVVSTSNFSYYQETIFLRYIEYEILAVINSFKNGDISQSEMLKRIHELENMSISTKEDDKTAEEIYSLISSNKNKIKTRFNKLSELAGFEEHDCIVIGARTGVGKSGFLLNLLEDLSDEYKCLYFDMEIGEAQVYERLVSINTKIPIKFFHNPATEYQREKIIEGCKNIASKNIKIYHNSQTVDTIKRNIVKESKDKHVIVFIDHLRLIKCDKNLSRYEKVSDIIEDLRRIAMDCNCTIISACHLKRIDDEEIPQLRDLKDSGEIENSSTSVIFLHDPNFEKNMSKDEVEIELFVAKNRKGPTGKTELHYNKANQRYEVVKKQIAEPNSWRKE